MARFSGKVAIITGAASGIGKEIALRFGAEGGTPVIADLNRDAAEAAARGIKSKGADAFAVAMDVTNEEAVELGIAAVMTKYGRIDILVSNAGVQIVRPLVDFPFADWKKLLAIHLDGAFLTTKACLKHLRRRKDQRAHRPVPRREPRLVYAVTRPAFPVATSWPAPSRPPTRGHASTSSWVSIFLQLKAVSQPPVARRQLTDAHLSKSGLKKGS